MGGVWNWQLDSLSLSSTGTSAVPSCGGDSCQVMAASDEKSNCPTIDEVLNELKRNGSFDKFRKSCLSTVQAEVKHFYGVNF